MGTYTEFTYQIVFGGKNRNHFLPEEHQNLLFSFFYEKIKSLSCFPIIQGGHVDHLHLLFAAKPSKSISSLVQELKKSSHKFLDDHKEQFPNFTEWQVGFGGFTYRKSDRPQLIRYIENQKDHHKKENFEEELIRLYREHNIPFDRRYLFT